MYIGFVVFLILVPVDGIFLSSEEEETLAVTNCKIIVFKKMAKASPQERELSPSRADVGELELIRQEVGGTGFIEVQLKYGILDLIACVIGHK